MGSVLSPRALGALAAALLGELVGPSRCAACDLPLAARVLFCPPCAASVERAAHGRDARADGWTAAFEYGGAMAIAIGKLKYEDRADLGPLLGRSMLRAAEPLRGAVDVVVPVPLHPRRLADRGYNQAALLAAPIARALGATLAPRALERRRDTTRQASLGRARRVVNVDGVFAAREPARMRGARVLLIDDVRTTGATLGGCETALHDVGARAVLALVLAHRT